MGLLDSVLGGLLGGGGGASPLGGVLSSLLGGGQRDTQASGIGGLMGNMLGGGQTAGGLGGLVSSFQQAGLSLKAGILPATLRRSGFTYQPVATNYIYNVLNVTESV